MNCRLSLGIFVFAALFFPAHLFAGPGGGHGGGGHGGGGSHGGGHFGSGGVSGYSFGHAVGHSLGHLFGHRPGGHGPGLGKNADNRADNAGRPVHFSMTYSARRRRIFLHNRVFFSGFCDPFQFSWRDFLFPRDFDCFADSLVFDPFFNGGPSNTYFWSDSLADLGDSEGSAESLDMVASDLAASTREPGAGVPLPSEVRQHVVLLQLVDGSMYGLRRYWLEGTDLHYVTTYGGENSVPLVRIDFAKTMQLNATRGIQFDVTRSFPNP